MSPFFAFYFTVPRLFKAFRELKLPTKQGESWKEGDKPGGEKREALTLETPPGFSKSEKNVWRDGERAGDEGRTRAFADRCIKLLLFYREFYTS